MGPSVVCPVLCVAIALTRSSANSPVPTDASMGSAVSDDLPPFATLTTDEDRERKAERSSPGTYNVIVNPDSFQHLPEYSEDAEVKRERLSPLRRGSVSASLASSLGRDSVVEGIPVPGDPNIVVLPRFEDIARRGTFSSKDPLSPSTQLSKVKSEDSMASMNPPLPPAMIDETPSTTTIDSRYLTQFRHVVWKQLVPAELDQVDGMDSSSFDFMELAAQSFPPVRRRFP